MKKFIALIVALAMLGVVGCAAAEPDTVSIRIAALKGPTAMGMVQMMQQAESGELPYEFTMAGTADEIVASLVKGDLDVAAVPANLASVIYNNTQGAIQAAAINTLGVLYVLEVGNEINSIADLKGQTIYSTGKGTTPEYALNYILGKNGIDPTSDVSIEFKSEPTELAAALESGTANIAVLPQPYVATVLAKNENVRMALNLSEEWDTVSADNGSALITGVLVARREFIQNNADAFTALLENYQASIAFTNSDVDAASELIANYGIVGAAAIAKQAIPYCNIVYIDGADMQAKLGGYLAALYAQNPKAVGGNLPDDAFYYRAEEILEATAA